MITNEYINRAIDYILLHINEELSVDEIAAHCNFSKYYFSRMFKVQTGESIGEFIRRVKMEQSAIRLKAETGRSITDICCEYGYSSSNYSTAFKQRLHVTPAEFRRRIKKQSLINPFYSDADRGLDSYEVCCQKISIETLADFPVVYQRYKGSYREMTEHWSAFQEQYEEYITEETVLIERTYDDPTITDKEECLYDICMKVPEGYTFENTYIIKGGKFAVYHFKGQVKQIYAAFQSITNVWIPLSGNKLDRRYGFDIYKKVDCDTMNMEIDICIPIK